MSTSATKKNDEQILKEIAARKSRGQTVHEIAKDLKMQIGDVVSFWNRAEKMIPKTTQPKKAAVKKAAVKIDMADMKPNRIAVERRHGPHTREGFDQVLALRFGGDNDLAQSLRDLARVIDNLEPGAACGVIYIGWQTQ